MSQASPTASTPAPRRRVRTILLLIIVIAAAAAGWQAYQNTSASQTLTLSGTIEATQVHLASQVGGQVKQVHVSEGSPIQAGEDLIDIYSMSGSGVNEEIAAPIDGVVMEQLIQPGEIASPGGTLMIVADLNTLTLTVYVPEDRYGQVILGKTYPVTVDSFPGQTFLGKVSHIADQAQFTPRNVQTVDGRKTTVFAVKLDLPPSSGKLKPGMPADVNFLG